MTAMVASPSNHRWAPSVWLTYGVLIISAAIYGGTALVTKTAVSRNVSELIFAFYRTAGGALLLLVALLLCPRLRHSNVSVTGSLVQDAARFALLGALMAGNVLGFIFGSTQLPAVTCAILQPSTQVVAMCLSALCGLESITLAKFVSVLFSVTGAIIVVHFAHPQAHGHGAEGFGPHTSLGFAAILGNVICNALYFVFQKPLLNTYSPVVVVALSYAATASIIFPMACATVGIDRAAWLMKGDYVAWLCATFSMCFTTALMYGMLAWANKNTTPTTVTACATLQPVFAVCFSWAILGIPLAAPQALGGVCLMAGLLFYARTLTNENAESGESRKLLTK